MRLSPYWRLTVQPPHTSGYIQHRYSHSQRPESSINLEIAIALYAPIVGNQIMSNCKIGLTLCFHWSRVPHSLGDLYLGKNHLHSADLRVGNGIYISCCHPVVCFVHFDATGSADCRAKGHDILLGTAN